MSVPAISKNLKPHSTASLDAECQVFKGPLLDVEWKKNEETVDLRDVGAHVMNNFGKTTPYLCSLYKVALTIGFTSATVECVFSRRTIIDSARRRSMTPYRESNLTLLYFEKQLCKEVTFEEFKLEWRRKPRRITLNWFDDMTLYFVLSK